MKGLLSILRRELLTTLRGHLAFVLLLIYVAVLSTSFCAAWPQTDDFIANRQQTARGLFQTFALTQLMLILLLAPSVTAPAISGERETKTLDLLVTTALGPQQVIRGKFLSGILFLLFLLVASLPPLSLVFLLGGVAPAEVFLVYCMLLASTMLFGMMGTVCSCFCQRTHNALFMAYAIILIIPLLWPFKWLLVMLALLIAFVAPLFLVSFVGVFAPYMFIRQLFSSQGSTAPLVLILIGVCYLLLTLVMLHFLYRLALWRFARPDSGPEARDTPSRLPAQLRLPRVERPFRTRANTVFEKDVRTFWLARWPVLLPLAVVLGALMLVFAAFLGPSLPGMAGSQSLLAGVGGISLTVALLLAPLVVSTVVFAEREQLRLQLLYSTLVTPATVLRAKFRVAARVLFWLCAMPVVIGIAMRWLVLIRPTGEPLLRLALLAGHFTLVCTAAIAFSLAVAARVRNRFRAIVTCYGTVAAMAAAFPLLRPVFAAARGQESLPVWLTAGVLPSVLDLLSPWWMLASTTGDSVAGLDALQLRWPVNATLLILLSAACLWLAWRGLQPARADRLQQG